MSILFSNPFEMGDKELNYNLLDFRCFEYDLHTDAED
jgi:hypothetical protein